MFTWFDSGHFDLNLNKSTVRMFQIMQHYLVHWKRIQKLGSFHYIAIHQILFSLSLITDHIAIIALMHVSIVVVIIQTSTFECIRLQQNYNLLHEMLLNAFLWSFTKISSGFHLIYANPLKNKF